MELIGTIDKKFVVDGNTIKVAVTVSASKEVLSFIKDVAGMQCDMYVDARYREKPTPAAPDDGQKAMFDEDGNPITPDPDEPEDEETEDDDNNDVDEAPAENADATEDAPQEVQ